MLDVPQETNLTRNLVPHRIACAWPAKTSSSINWQARGINEKEKACQIAINVLPPGATEVHDRLAEDHRHARRSKRNKASLRDIEAKTHQPGWRFCGFFEKLRRGRLLKNMIHEVLETWLATCAMAGEALNVELGETHSSNYRARRGRGERALSTPAGARLTQQWTVPGSNFSVGLSRASPKWEL